MTKSKNSENNDGNYSDLLEILREKQKIRLGNFKSGEYLTLEYNIEEANPQPEPLIVIPTSSDSIGDISSDANTNPLPESAIFISPSYNSKDDIGVNSYFNSTNQERSDAFLNKESKVFSKVFISYSHDSEEHKKRVKELSERLNKIDGIKCVLDQDVVKLEYKWPRWMSEKIEEADFVIIICTKQYKERAYKKRGSGVYMEASLIETLLSYDSNYNKFLSVIFSEKGTDIRVYIPTFLLGLNVHILDVTNDKSYEAEFQQLCDRIKYQPSESRQKLDERGISPPE
ncbi:TIR domain-containing protein [Nostocaceae cyanobacterium CENA369]|uniref:TIR domain-containing protein n=1 Tax=Dendronalium phyllosphericum CENA369 TaxID=1725256 RepID=A0A8J7I8Q8_9NOST|nr:TIR domain-containing protein [Dendronalium phyllosphericum]MBH8576910.1 TIR domain-containing protein [Dendronalium phyllosphericum CENA369]